MRLDFFRSDRFWKWVLGVGIGVFLLTRLLTLTSFPIFNDESIYLQYSQAIHADSGKYKFISEGGMYADWKPPLQYWFGSIFFGFVSDPLLAGRLASFFISLFGFLGLYLFIGEFLGKREAAAAVLLYALLPPAIFFNIQFVAETFVFSLAFWMYWCFLRAIQTDRIRPQYALLAAVFGALVLLSKQSGMTYLLLATLLPLTALGSVKKGNNEAGKAWNWRGFFIRAAVVAGGIVVALLLRRLGMSAESARLEGRFNANWLMGPQDILGFPLETWKNNWLSIRDYYFHYYSVFILPPILYFFFITLRRLEFRNITVGLGFLGGSSAVLFLLKGFNEYIYNTAVIIFLVPLLTVAFFAAWRAATAPRDGGGTAWRMPRAAGALVLASFALMLVHWTYQDVLMRVSPADYIRRGTPWAVSGYLENWSGGFGVAEAIAYVKKQQGPGLVLADPQWGNPRTALEVYNAIPPRTMQVVGLTRDFNTPEDTQAAKKYVLGQPFKTRLVVFSTARNEVRAVWQDNVEKYLCDTREEIQVEPTQPPIVICSF